MLTKHPIFLDPVSAYANWLRRIMERERETLSLFVWCMIEYRHSRAWEHKWFLDSRSLNYPEVLNASVANGRNMCRVVPLRNRRKTCQSAGSFTPVWQRHLGHGWYGDPMWPTAFRRFLKMDQQWLGHEKQEKHGKTKHILIEKETCFHRRHWKYLQV